MVRPVNLEGVKLEGLRGRVAAFLESDRFVNTIAGLIVLNAILLGLETDPEVKFFFGGILELVDFTILSIFVVEIILKLFAYRLSFFRNGWNVFDFVIIAGSLVSVGGAMAILRSLRIFRVLRLMSIIPHMRRVLKALFDAVPGMASILGIMMIIFYVAAVLATNVFGSHPSPEMQTYFGNMGASMFTLFQIMTLEDWPDVAGPTIALFPWAWVYFIVFIISTTFAVLNLFVGIIVDAMDIVHDFEGEDQGIKDAVQKEAEDIHADIGMLRGELAEIKELLKGKS